MSAVAAAAETTGAGHFKAFVKSERETKTAIKADGEGRNEGKEMRWWKWERFLSNP